MTHGSLFAGIGGFDLGFRWAGIETVWQVEIDPYCRKVLERHFPEAERFNDVRECGSHNLKPVDIITGGFPCQDISYAGLGAGIDGERSGLWTEMHRIICELRPRFVVVENVAALLTRGIDRVLGCLAESGYDAEWSMLSACSLGAPHTRERLFVMAYPQGVGLSGRGNDSGHSWPCKSTGQMEAGNWALETRPPIKRVVNGIPARMDRLSGLGNAVVPQIAHWIGERILEQEKQ